MQLFGDLGVDFAAWALLSFTLGAFAGVRLRRAVRGFWPLHASNASATYQT
jgi:hypothetical protein